MEKINIQIDDISKIFDEKKILEEKNRKLEEKNKHLEKKLKEICKKSQENKILEETNKKLENKLEEISKNLEETNKKLEVTNKQIEEEEICNKDHFVSYRVSSSNDSETRHKNLWHCVGKYYHMGKYTNSFPIFRKGDEYLYVGLGGKWMIGEKAGDQQGYILHPANNPTPSTPPRNGWKYDKKFSWKEDKSSTVDLTSHRWEEAKSLTVDVISHTVPTPYLVSSSNCDAPRDVLGIYHPMGYFRNGFPIFHKMDNDDWVLFVDTNTTWRILNEESDLSDQILHPDKNPTPSIPPLIGWLFTGKGNAKYNSSLSVTAIAGEILAPASQFSSSPSVIPITGEI